MRKKKLKQRAFIAEVFREKTPEEREAAFQEYKAKCRERASRLKRRFPHGTQPFKSVRGVSKVRDCCCMGGSNGMLCLACLRTVQNVDECNHCGSTSLIHLESKCRKPPRKATRQHWIRFIRRWTYQGKYVLNGVMPDDFMANMRSK